MRLFLTEIPIFHGSIATVVNCSAEEAERALHSYQDKGASCEFLSHSEGGVRGYCGDIYVWIKDTSKASIVFHEAVHIAFCLCEMKGMKPDEEFIAYFVEWLKIEWADVIFTLEEEEK